MIEGENQEQPRMLEIITWLAGAHYYYVSPVWTSGNRTYLHMLGEYEAPGIK